MNSDFGCLDCGAVWYVIGPMPERCECGSTEIERIDPDDVDFDNELEQQRRAS